jgi:hypothetical protein
MKPTYLGDGVYISEHQRECTMLVLTTGSHILEEAQNVIYLEPEVALALLKVLSNTGNDINP